MQGVQGEGRRNEEGQRRTKETNLFATAVAVEGFLGDLQRVNLWRNIVQDLVRILVERQLGGHHICEVAERLGLKERGKCTKEERVSEK